MADYKPETMYVVNPITGSLDAKVDTKMPNWVITDVRFPNEAQAIKEKGGYVIRIDRPGVKPINDHPSETSLDTWKFDYKIDNVSDIVSLAFTLTNIISKIKE